MRECQKQQSSVVWDSNLLRLRRVILDFGLHVRSFPWKDTATKAMRREY